MERLIQSELVLGNICTKAKVSLSKLRENPHHCAYIGIFVIKIRCIMGRDMYGRKMIT